MPTNYIILFSAKVEFTLDADEGTFLSGLIVSENGDIAVAGDAMDLDENGAYRDQSHAIKPRHIRVFDLKVMCLFIRKKHIWTQIELK